jgi:hypothetical protein
LGLQKLVANTECYCTCMGAGEDKGTDHNKN